MQKIIFMLLFIMTLFTAKSQMSIISVTPTVFCTGATVTVKLHLGPDRSMFYDSLSENQYGPYAPDSFRFSPTMTNFANTQIIGGYTLPYLYVDTTMLNHDFTYRFIATNASDSLHLYFQESVSYYQGPPFNDQTAWLDSMQYNTNIVSIFQNVYYPKLYADTTTHTCCPNSILNISASAFSYNDGQFIWTNSLNDTAFGSTITIPYGSNQNIFGTYSCIFIDTVGDCKSSFGLTTINRKQSPFQNICVVTLDSTLTHNVIVWDKNQPADTATTAMIDSFFIMRGTQQINAQPFSSYSSYQDNNADISLQAWTYSINVKDGCGLENNWGNTVTTMFQEQPNNGDVTWYPYSGTAFSGTYSVLRNTGGNSSWTLLDTITVNSSPITIHDTSATIPLNTKYRVEANGGSCIPRSPYTIYSNVGIVGVNGIDQVSSELLEIYPNPTSGQIHLSKSNLHLILSDVTGNKINEVFNSGNTLDVSSLTPGMYFLNCGTYTMKIVKL